MGAKKTLSWIGGILGIILLGAIGSGVWSGILGPTFRWFVDTIVRTISSFSTTFKNYIYLEAAKGFHEAFALNTYILIVSVMLGLSIGYFLPCCIG